MNIDSTAVENYLRSRTEVHKGWRPNDSDEKRICCPFCTEKKDEDTGYHLGVNVRTGQFNCFRCDTAGFITRLIRYWDNVSLSEAVRIIESKARTDISIDRIELNGVKKEENDDTIELSEIKPPEYYESLVGKGHPYLESSKRRVDLKMVSDYSLGICRMGAYKDRIIIPDFNDDGGLIYWQARAIDDTVKPKYLNASNSRSGKTLFNFWRAKKYKTIILTEGAFDAMRVGFDGVCTYGHSIKEGQKKLLMDNNINEVVLMYDADVSINDLEVMAGELTSIFKVSIAHLQSGDPADHTTDELRGILEKRKTADEFFSEILSRISLLFKKSCI
jgi:DNA primase